MGQISTEEDVAQAATDKAVLDGRMSADLRELPPTATDLSVRRESTKFCIVDRKNVPARDDLVPKRRDPNVRARPLTNSSADSQLKATNIILRMNARIRAEEKKRRVIVVPD
jgi:hypothetical protein